MTRCALKRKGFSDARWPKLLGGDGRPVREHRQRLDMRPVYKRVDTCAAEFASDTAYMYSTYEEECEAHPATATRSWCSVAGPTGSARVSSLITAACTRHWRMREDGYETIMVNCNPETVSTDYDTSDRLYFEPVTLEDVLEIVDVEQPEGCDRAVRWPDAAEAGRALEGAGVPIIGTTPDAIDRAEDRERFQQMIQQPGSAQPANTTVRSETRPWQRQTIGYPLVVRPSYVLGGRAMEIVYRKKTCCVTCAKRCRSQTTPGAAGQLPQLRHRSGLWMR